MTVTASALRQNIYRLLDEVAETGKPLQIKRKGHLLEIAPAEVEPRPKLSRLTPHPCINGDPEFLVHMDWSDCWQGESDI
jgi:hypothetical protein